MWSIIVDSSAAHKEIEFNDISYIDDNNIFIAAKFTQTGSSGDAFVCKINSDGNVLALKKFQTQEDERLNKIIYFNNYFYMTGFAWINKCFLLKSDMNLNMQYIKYYDDPTIFGTLTNSGNIVMGGWVYTTFYAAARMVDLNGNEIWKRTIFDSYYYVLPLVFKPTGDNGSLMTGYEYDSVYDKNRLYLLRTDSNFTIEPIGIKFNNEIIEDFNLEQNYPNPFNPTTTIKYFIPQDGMIEFKVYDTQGREIIYFNGYKKQGEYEYEFDGLKLSSGVYFYQLTLRIHSGNEMSLTKKFVLMK